MPPQAALVAAPLLVGVASSGSPGGWGTLVEALGTIGALLVFLWGFHAGWWVPGRTHNRTVEELDAMTDKLDRHRERLETETIPLLVRATDALTHVTRLLPVRPPVSGEE